METDTAARLRKLAAELAERGWTAKLDVASGRLKVGNPAEPAMSDVITCRDGAFRWSWGALVAPAGDVPEAAERIMHVLRAVQA